MPARDPQPTLQKIELKVEAQHDMQAVGDLVGISPDEGSSDLVDGAIEGFERFGTSQAGSLGGCQHSTVSSSLVIARKRTYSNAPKSIPSERISK
jgi:hypothetical protein